MKISRKVFLSILLVLLAGSATYAETLKVEAISEFNTANPVKTMKVKLTEDVIYCGVDLVVGDVVTGEVVDITDPKRLKRDARFSFIPEYYVNKNGIVHKFDVKRLGKYSLPIDKGKVAKTTALSVGSYFVKGLSLGVNAVQGAIENEDGNRFKSAGKNVYENTPFSYVETGHELEIHKGDKFYLKFGRDAEEDSSDEEHQDLDY